VLLRRRDERVDTAREVDDAFVRIGLNGRLREHRRRGAKGREAELIRFSIPALTKRRLLRQRNVMPTPQEFLRVDESRECRARGVL
jgi:hypothetical protein